MQLQGVKNPERAIQLIGRTAQLEFKLIDSQADTELSALIAKAIASGRLKENFSHNELNQALIRLIPPDDEAYMEKRVDPETGRVTMVPVLLKKRTLTTGEMLKSAKVEITGRSNDAVQSEKAFSKIAIDKPGLLLVCFFWHRKRRGFIRRPPVLLPNRRGERRV